VGVTTADLELGRRVKGDIFGYNSVVFRLSKVLYKVFPDIPNQTNVAHII
jgi:hypothetical protein